MSQQKHLYNKRKGRVADFFGTTSQNRVCVHYPSLVQANGLPLYGQVRIGRFNVWISDDQYRVLRLAEQKRQLKRKNAFAKDVIQNADRIIAAL